MTDIVVTKDGAGKLVGFRDQDRRAYAKLRKIMVELEPGELLTLRYWFQRNGRFHRLHMGLLRMFFESQEAFTDELAFRQWTEIGAGHVNWVPGQDGAMVAVVKSINYAEIDDEEMHKLHEATKVFLRGEHAQEILWPSIPASDRAAGAEGILAVFEDQT